MLHCVWRKINREKKNKSSNIIVCFSLITVQGQGRRYQRRYSQPVNQIKKKLFGLDGALGQCSVFISSDNLNWKKKLFKKENKTKQNTKKTNKQKKTKKNKERKKKKEKKHAKKQTS